MKYLITLCCFVCSVTNGQNCSHSLKGIVNDFHDGSIIEGATLYIKELNTYTTSDDAGNFVFKSLCANTYTLLVSHVSCETKTKTVSIPQDTMLDITLEHHTEELSEITVKGTGNKQTQTAQETTIKTEDIENFSSASLGDALKTVSGVSSLNTGNTIVKPVINGLHSSRIIIMSNGVRLQDQEWGIEHAPNIDINASGSVSVIKGADALAFGGDAIGGAIVLNPLRVILKDSLYGKVIASGQDNGRGYSISGSLSKTFEEGWYVSGQGTHKRFGDFEAPDYVLSNTGLNSSAFSLNTGYKTFEKGVNVFYSYTTNEIGILRASHIGNVEDLVNSINSLQPIVVNDFSNRINAPKQEVTHQLLKAEVFKRIKAFGKLKLQYDFQNNQRFEFDIRVGNDRDKAAVDLALKTHTISADLKIDNSEKNTYKLGALARYQNNFPNPETGVRRLIPDYDKYDVGTYFIFTRDLNDKLLVNLGARYDFSRIDAQKFYQTSRWIERGYDIDFGELVVDTFGNDLLTNPVFDYHNISASAGLAYNLSDEQKLLFNYSISNRAPNPSELFSDGLHHSAARIELGDLRINKENSNRVSGTYTFNNNKWNVSLEAFYNLISDFIYLEPFGTEQTIRGAFPVWEYKQTDANIVGVDLTMDYQINKNWRINNKSSYTSGRDRINKRPVIDMPPIEFVNTLSYTKPEWNNLDLSIVSELVLRQTEFPNNNFETFIPTTGETVLVDISTPPPGYHLVHFRAGVDFNLNSKSDLAVGLNINNVLNTSYRNYLNRLRYFADDLGRTIQLQLKINI